MPVFISIFLLGQRALKRSSRCLKADCTPASVVYRWQTGSFAAQLMYWRKKLPLSSIYHVVCVRIAVGAVQVIIGHPRVQNPIQVSVVPEVERFFRGDK